MSWRDAYHSCRRKLAPASKYDVDWRHQWLDARLNEISSRLLTVEALEDSFASVRARLEAVDASLAELISARDDQGPRWRDVVEAGFRQGRKVIETEATDEELLEIFERVRLEWSRLGESEPYWSVLTSEQYTKSNFSKHQQEFWDSGAHAAAAISDFFESNDLKRPSGVCLELGCGVGRVTRYLSPMFEKVIGLDISSGNLREAQINLREVGASNVELIKIEKVEDFDTIPNVDFFCSEMVLQHNPPPVQRVLLDKIFSKIKTGGGCLFQTPTDLPHYSFRIRDYLETEEPVMEMHALPMRVVLNALRAHDLPLIEVRPDIKTGLPGSHTFFAHGKLQKI